MKVVNCKSKIISGLALCLLCAIWSMVLLPASTQALGLKTAPLLYEVKLEEGEKQKGFVDISNPNDQEVTVVTEVQAFRQINDEGELEFYNKAEYTNGIKLDYESFALKSREALRLYFLLDANQLPSGGVYVTLLFKTTTSGANPDNTSIQPATRVGTHLLIENGGGGIKNAFIKEFKAPLFQIGSAVSATAHVSNPGGAKSLAFFPELTSNVEPFGKTKKQKAPLVFPNNTRTVPISLPGNHFGLVRLHAKTGSNEAYAWSFVATGHGRWLGPLVLASVAAGVYGVAKHRKQIVKLPVVAKLKKRFKKK